MSLSELSAAKKTELVTSLAVLVCSDAGADATPENLTAVITASGNTASPMWVSLFAKALAANNGSIEKFVAAPGSGGGGAAAAGGAAAPAAAAAVAEVEEEEMDMGGGNMFGEEAAGGGDY